MFNIIKNLFSNRDNTAMEDLIKEGAFLVDVRSRAEFAGGHVKGSTNIPLDQIKNQIVQFKNKKSIIVFCASGMRSSQAKMILENNGFSNVINGRTWQSVNNIVNK